MKYKQFLGLPVMMAAILLSSLIFPVKGQAGGVVGDGTPKSCTEATLDAALSNGGRITFDCGPSLHTISISSPKTITVDTTLDGQHLITLSGRNLSRIFAVTVNATLNLQQLTLANGSANLGGAIYNAGSMEITDCVLINNQSSGGSGGGIYNDGTLAISNSTLSNNGAQNGWGGAIFNAGWLYLKNNTISNNSGDLAGGGILNTGSASIIEDTFINNSGGYGGGFENWGTAIIMDSNITSNITTHGMGGGVHNTGQLTISGSTLSGNSSAAKQNGGGLSNQGNAKITNSLFINNAAPGGLGAGIFNNGQLTILADSFASNQAGAGWGGAIYSGMGSSLDITNSTFYGNFGGNGGGGLYAGGSANMLNSTFYDNLPNSIVHNGLDRITIKNSIVAGSPSENCKGAITSLGNNLEDKSTCSFTASGDLQNTDPKLGSLAYHNGITPTNALLPGSPAINAGANDACPLEDERGARRPVFGICDIGAYEYGFSVSLPVVNK
jgi:hypothetical protein